MYASVYIISSLLTLSLGVFGSQVFPSSFSFLAEEVNGSSANGRCSNFTTREHNSTICTQPNSSVLFDGNIPTLTGLDGDMWASQLLVLHTIYGASQITFNLNDTVRRVEVVMYNCAAKGTRIFIRNQEPFAHTTINCSCKYLVRICLTHTTPIEGDFALVFTSRHQIYLAEVTLYGEYSGCPPETIITTPPPDTTIPPPPDTTILEEMIIASSPSNVVPSTSSEPCPASSTSTVLVSVITSFATALLATVIFVLMQIAVCKYHPKYTPGGAETGASAGAEGQEYEKMGDPTYMEVGAGGRTFQLEENEAYTAHGGENDFGLRKNEAYATLN